MGCYFIICGNLCLNHSGVVNIPINNEEFVVAVRPFRNLTLRQFLPEPHQQSHQITHTQQN
jgi:hypothetical protein